MSRDGEVYDRLLAIDPGTTDSAWVLIVDGKIDSFGKEPNELVRLRCRDLWFRESAIEMIGHYGTGMPAGKSVFETVRWIGKFEQTIEDRGLRSPHIMLRPTVKTILCGTPRAKDGNVRQVMLDTWGPQGTKKNPGPTYGIAADVWQALAVATAYRKQQEQEARTA